MTRSISLLLEVVSFFAIESVFRELHDDEIEDEIREAFRCFDKDGHGFIPVTGYFNDILIDSFVYENNKGGKL